MTASEKVTTLPKAKDDRTWILKYLELAVCSHLPWAVVRREGKLWVETPDRKEWFEIIAFPANGWEPGEPGEIGPKVDDDANPR